MSMLLREIHRIGRARGGFLGAACRIVGLAGGWIGHRFGGRLCFRSRPLLRRLGAFLCRLRLGLCGDIARRLRRGSLLRHRFGQVFAGSLKCFSLTLRLLRLRDLLLQRGLRPIERRLRGR
ncbi:MAG: hypothetical protein QM770_11515 [Tepidisphaeraceae bacterium]